MLELLKSLQGLQRMLKRCIIPNQLPKKRKKRASRQKMKELILHPATVEQLMFRSEYDVTFIHSFIPAIFYSAPSSPLLLRGAPDYSTDTVSEFHAEAHRQLQVKDLPKVLTWRLERESSPRPSD